MFLHRLLDLCCEIFPARSHGVGGNLKTAAKTGKVLSRPLVGEYEGSVAKSEGMEGSKPYEHSK